LNNFSQRLLTGIAFVAVLLGSIIFSPYSFIILFSSITFFGLWEFFTLAEKLFVVPQKIFCSFAGTLFFLLSSFAFFQKIGFDSLLLCIPVLFFIFFAELFSNHNNPFTNIAFSVLGIFYIIVPFSLLACIAFNHGIYTTHLVLGLFFIIWANDTGAYLVGVKFGKHRLYEKISPKKSWEGSMGGAISSLLVSWIVSEYFFELTTRSWLVVALIIIVTGTLGDLSKSQFKRSIGVKDSGNILPGHGGILDRFDALLMAVPFVFTYLYFIEKEF
jgi:phosphatidate cytidylyltransferase